MLTEADNPHWRPAEIERDRRHRNTCSTTPRVPQSYSQPVTDSDCMNEQHIDRKQDTQELEEEAASYKFTFTSCMMRFLPME